MWRRGTRLAVATAASAVIAGGIIAGVATGQSEIAPEATVSAIALPPDVRNYRDPIANVGSASDIASVQGDIVADLRRDREIMRPNVVPIDLRVQLSEIYATSVLDKVTMETQKAITDAAGDPSYLTYDQYNITVTEWQGIQVTSPVTATATFLGYESWHLVSTGAWDQDQPLQWQLVLAKEDGRWKLVEEAAFDPDERPACDPDQTPCDGQPRMP
jgi:hypothetical protein